MLGTTRLLTFAIRALALLVLISILWVSAAKPYNQVLAILAQPIAPENIDIELLGVDILFRYSESALPVSIDALTLHYGLIFLAAIVLAAVGIRTLPRIRWLLALSTGAFLTHVAGVALLAHGVAWMTGSESPDETSRLMFSVFAVSWGLLPALAGGAWCFFYWLPTVAESQIPIESETSDAPLSFF